MVEAQASQFRVLLTQGGLTPEAIHIFQALIWQYYHAHGRSFPWRETHSPYHILVSEIMLQQTQISRVLRKYSQFINAFPNFFALARAPLREVLRVWQGLGYNRRALALWRTAQEIVSGFDGMLPSDPEALQQLPGIGQYTAAAVAAIAFNKPTVFIETNIRAVFLHFFFGEMDKAVDHDILPLVAATLDRQNPRGWYYALFDYGAMLKQHGRSGARDLHHRRQGIFEGSNRQMRGRILQIVVDRTLIEERDIIALIGQNSERLAHALQQLKEEGFIEISDGMIHIK